jgi:predicted AAA+ superfamily ATPase
MTLGGFPEPFLSGDEREAKRWRRERFDRVINEDIRDLEAVRHLQLLHLFVDALRDRVGGIITLSNIAQDLQISPQTAKVWLALLEKMYLCFAVYPLTQKVPRAIQKPPKVYFFDNGDVLNDHGARYENLVATHLLKRLQFLEDYTGSICTLHYIRDKEAREVDFVTLIDGRVVDLIEVKEKDETITSSLKYYQNLLKPERTTLLVAQNTRSYDKDSIRVSNPLDFFLNPPW